MPYWRNYAIDATQEEKQWFIASITERLDEETHYLHLNDYPYNMHQKRPVMTHHWTLWYTDIEDVIKVINSYTHNWYAMILNTETDQSIPDIKHLHFIKEK